MTTTSHSEVWVAVLVALAALAGPGVAFAEDETQEATFAESVVVEQRGDVAVVTVYLPDTDGATLTVGSEDVNYLTEVQVTDGDGDGVVQVRINTHLAGGWTGAAESEAYATADGSDGVSVTRETAALDQPLGAGDYDMELSVGGSATDVATLSLEDPSSPKVTTLTAPETVDTSDGEAVLSAAAKSNDVAAGDIAVVVASSEGTAGYVNDVSDLADGSQGVSLELVEANPPPNQAANRLNIETGDLHTVERADMVVLAVDTDDVDVSPGEEYEARLAVADENPYFSGEISSSDTFTVRKRTASVAGDPVTVEPRSDAIIRGSATHAPGTELLVRARSDSSSDPFLIEESVTVDGDGEFAASMDFSGTQDGTEFTVEVLEDGEAVSAETRGVVDDGTATTTTTEQTTRETTTRPTPTPTTTAFPTTTTENPITSSTTTVRTTTTESRSTTVGTSPSDAPTDRTPTATTIPDDGFANTTEGTGNVSFASGGQPGLTWPVAVVAVALTLVARRSWND